MKLVIKTRPLSEFLALIALGIFLVVSILDVTFYARYLPEMVYKGCVFLAVFLLGIKEFLKGKYDWKTILGAFATILIYFTMSSVTSLISTITIGVLFIYALRDIPFNDVAKTALITSVGLLVFVIISARLGIITNYLEISGNRVRSYLGFRYALFPSSLLLNIVAIVFYLKQDKIRYWQWILLALFVYWVYSQTDSRLTFYNSCILLVCNLLLKWSPNLLSKFYRIFNIFGFTYFVNAILSFWVSIAYLGSTNVTVNNFFYKLNQFLGGRLYLANRSLNIFGYGWFGRPVDWVGNGLSSEGQRSTRTYFYVDNLYIQILQRYGLLVLMSMLTLLTLTLFKVMKRGQWVIALILIVMSFHSVIDDLNISIRYNIFWIVIGCLINSDYQFASNEDETL